MVRVFVYGTLLGGLSNNYLMDASNGVLVGSTTTKDKYTMVSLGGFPAVVLDTPSHPIVGELWEVETVELLDRLEGYPNFYDRKVINLIGGETAYMYYVTPDYLEYNIVPNGNWRAFYANRSHS